MMNTTQMSPDFAAAFRARLVEHVTKTAPPLRRRRRVFVTGAIALSLMLGGTATAAATGLLPLPGGRDTTELAGTRIDTFTGSGALELGEQPSRATGVAVSLKCLSPGTFVFDDGAALDCTASGDGTHSTTYTVPISAISNDQVTITTDPDAVWSLSAVWVSEETTDWVVNDEGHTYGVLNDDGEPDLIAVMTTDDKLGYVWKADLDEADGTTAARTFTSPEDALRWQEENAGIVRHIPVYESDGKTQVGIFQVGGN